MHGWAGLQCLTGVSVGGTGVSLGAGTEVFVGGADVAVGEMAVFVGGTGVLVALAPGLGVFDGPAPPPVVAEGK